MTIEINMLKTEKDIKILMMRSIDGMCLLHILFKESLGCNLSCYLLLSTIHQNLWEETTSEDEGKVLRPRIVYVAINSNIVDNNK